MALRNLLRVVFCLLGLGVIPQISWATDDNVHALPHHHLSGMLGYALERKRGHDEEAGALGLDYAFRFHEHWSVGAFAEALGDDVVRNVSVGVIANYHPADGWALFAGPGYEFTETKDKALFRVGAGYDFEFQNRWTLGPKFIYDIISGGYRTYILGIALGREF